MILLLRLWRKCVRSLGLNAGRIKRDSGQSHNLTEKWLPGRLQPLSRLRIGHPFAGHPQREGR